MNGKLIWLLCGVVLRLSVLAEVAGYVDPMIGTVGTGHVFPGPCRPFGLVQPSPDTGNGSWKYCSGYAGDDCVIRRFSQTHLNGTGQAGLGDVGLLPFTGELPDDLSSLAAPFEKRDEHAVLGKYAVRLADGTAVEIAAGRRLAHYRLTFPKDARGKVLLDFPYGLYRQANYLPLLTASCRVERVSAARLEGANHSEVFAPRDVFYVVELTPTPARLDELPRLSSDKGPRYVAEFPVGGAVEVRIALSARSLAGARKNFAAEAATGFDRRVDETVAEWEGYLSRISLAGRTLDEKKSICTALYRLFIQPNVISDVDEKPRYSTFSLWDTFRDAHPLYEKLVPELVGPFVESLLNHYDRWGYLPRWELWGRETNCMIGSHGVAVVVNAYLNGFRGFDVEKAYAAVKATLTEEKRPGAGKVYPRRTDWKLYDRYGYFPFDLVPRESVSRTLECSLDDFLAARFARALGKAEDAAYFERRSWNFTNLFDVATLCFRAKDSRGKWRESLDPANALSTPDYTEGSALQYSWFVPHRPEWLVAAMGGPAAFEARLDAFFAGMLFPGSPRNRTQDITGLIGDYAHGNEPCHHVPGLYRLVGRPDKERVVVRSILRDFYRPVPDGLCGNDDCGQMSAWYLRSMVAGEAATSGSDRFKGASWIAGNEITQPDADFGEAQWIVPEDGMSDMFERRFVLREKPTVAELAFVVRGGFSVEINGLRRFGGAARDIAPVGRFHDWRFAKFIDVAPALKVGENTIRLKVTGPKEDPPSALLSLALPDGMRIVTDANWTNAKEVGGVRDVAWAKDVILRREVNSPAFEKRFDLVTPVRKATLSISGLGFYEATLNGCRVGNKRLDPIPSNYDKRVYYSVYNVTDMLSTGVNVLGVLLGHGWYDVRSIATWNWDMAPWRTSPRLLARLDIEGTDGSRVCVVSDGSWRQIESPIGYDCIREGEVIGARNRRAVDLAKKVVLAQEVEAPRGRLVEEMVPPTVVKRVVPAVRVDKIGDVWRVDFGEDLAGVMRMRFSDAVRGRVVSFRYDERDGVTVDPVDKRDGTDAIGDGHPERRIDCHFGWTASHDVLPGGVFQCDRYVTRGEVGEVYEPRFTYNGFRYVFIGGLGRAPRTDECEALVLQTDFESIGSFECSDPTFSSLVKMADKAYRSNFVNGIPTDCPHREKNGWTADAALASEMAMYAYENTAAYADWLEQIAESQRADGMIAEIVPTSGWGYRGLLDWDAAIALLPMTIYRYRGEGRPLIEMYPTLTNYLEKVAIPGLKDGLYTRVRGDWVSAGTRPDNGIVGTCYFKLMTEVAAFTASLLGCSAEAARYSRFALASRDAFNRAYARGNGFYGDEKGRQTTQAMALEFGMVPDADVSAARNLLVSAVKATDGHLDFGLHGMKWVPRALSKAGRTDLAFQMFVKDTPPSPAMWLKRGGTSLWEDWGNGASRNHIMFGEFVCWAYQYLAGIRLAEDGMGFRKVIIDPMPIVNLHWVKGSIRLPTGLLLSSWKRVNGAVNLRVTVPSHVEAQVCLPSGVEILRGPAVREWECPKWNCGQDHAGGL